jgi:tRNA(Ile)-lysidine synthase TilS/MesJ
MQIGTIVIRSTLKMFRPLQKRIAILSALKKTGGVRGFRTAPISGDSVVVAMSGGVDSSLAARLLAEKDYNLRAVYMRNWDRRDELASDTGCEWEKDWEDVQRVCRQLDIPCEMVGFDPGKILETIIQLFILD